MYAEPSTPTPCRSPEKDQDSGNLRSSDKIALDRDTCYCRSQDPLQTPPHLTSMSCRRNIKTLRTCSRIAQPHLQAYQASTVKSPTTSSMSSLNCCSSALPTASVGAQSASSQSCPCSAPPSLRTSATPYGSAIRHDMTNISIFAVRLPEETGNWTIVVEPAQLHHVVSLLSSCPLIAGRQHDNMGHLDIGPCLW